MASRRNVRGEEFGLQCVMRIGGTGSEHADGLVEIAVGGGL